MDFSISKGITSSPKKIVVYGTGGIGKSELCANISQVGINPLFLDLENGTANINTSRIEGDKLATWDALRAALRNDSIIDQFDAIVIDSVTKAEELAVEWTLQNVPKTSDKDGSVKYMTSIEGYGYGRGFSHVYETFLMLLQDLDSIVRRGKHVILVSHDCVTNVPNPSGDDWIRYEPRLQSPASGKSSIRLRVKEWCDHLLFVGYDTLAKDGKATGGGTRTIYPSERPAWMAKSRSLDQEVVYERGSAEIWKLIFGKAT